MSLSKNRFQASKVKVLTPIREESSVQSPRISPRTKKVRINQQSILVQTLPPAMKPAQKAKEAKHAVTDNPGNSSVDHIVEDYLHYANYSRSLPLHGETWGNNNTLHCPCCTERNRENMRRLRGGGQTDNPIQPSPRVDHGGPSPALQSTSTWMNYQLMPYAQTYLNPEFNRPYVIQEYLESTQPDDQSGYIKTKVLDANSRFDEAMKKLQTTTRCLDPDLEHVKLSFT